MKSYPETSVNFKVLPTKELICTQVLILIMMLIVD